MRFKDLYRNFAAKWIIQPFSFSQDIKMNLPSCSITITVENDLFILYQVNYPVNHRFCMCHSSHITFDNSSIFQILVMSINLRGFPETRAKYLKFTSHGILHICGQQICWKLLNAFLNWFCQYLLFSINSWLYFLNSFFNRLKVWGYHTLAICKSRH